MDKTLAFSSTMFSSSNRIQNKLKSEKKLFSLHDWREIKAEKPIIYHQSFSSGKQQQQQQQQPFYGPLPGTTQVSRYQFD